MLRERGVEVQNAFKDEEVEKRNLEGEKSAVLKGVDRKDGGQGTSHTV